MHSFREWQSLQNVVMQWLWWNIAIRVSHLFRHKLWMPEMPYAFCVCMPDSPEGMVMGHTDLRESEELRRRLSVECSIEPDSVIPPTIIFHGTKDRIVNCEGSVILYRRMKECGKDVKLYLIEGADHGGNEFWTKQVVDIMDDFIQRVI